MQTPKLSSCTNKERTSDRTPSGWSVLSTGKDVAVFASVPLPVTYSALPDVYTQSGLSPTQIWTIVWAYRMLSVFIAVVIVGLTVGVVALLPRTFEGTATLIVDYEVNDPLNGKEFPIGLLSGYMATQTELLRNPTLLATVVDRLKLTENADYTAGYSGDGSTLHEYVRRTLNRNLTIYQGQFGSQLIYVTYAAGNPEEAALVANTVADVFKEQDFVRTTAPTVERATRYTEQLEELRRKVGQAQEQYTAFNERNALIDAGENGANVEIGLLSSLEEQLLEAQHTRRLAQAASSADPAVGDQVMSSPLVQSLKAQLAGQESLLADLQLTLTPQHPQVLQLQSQIETNRRTLAGEVRSYSRNSVTALSTAQRLEQEVQAATTAQRAKVISTSTLHDQAAKYRLELDSARTVYKSALDGYDEVMFASMGNYTNVSFVSRATPPVRASKPRVLVYLLLGGMAGCFLGLFMPLAYELTNRRVRCRDDLERDGGVPVLAEFRRSALARGVA
jgi:uncharacterized protein involved in exopolysaccharide biosynthesis